MQVQLWYVFYSACPPTVSAACPTSNSTTTDLMKSRSKHESRLSMDHNIWEPRRINMMEIMPSNFFLHLYMQEITKTLAFWREEKKQTQNVIKLWYIKVFPFWSLLIAFLKVKKENLSKVVAYSLNHHNCAKEHDEMLAKSASVSKRREITWVTEGPVIEGFMQEVYKGYFCSHLCQSLHLLKSHRERNFCG